MKKYRHFNPFRKKQEQATVLNIDDLINSEASRIGNNPPTERPDGPSIKLDREAFAVSGEYIRASGVGFDWPRNNNCVSG